MLTYLKPQSVDEAVGFLSKYDGVKILAGGTDVLAAMRDGERFSYLMDIKYIPELGKIEEAGGGLCVGAAVTMNELMKSEHIKGCYSIINDAGLVFANYPLRNRATLLGNLCSAQPAGDMIPVSLVLGGYIDAVSPQGERRIPLEEFFPAFKTSALKKDELALRVVYPKRDGKGIFLKKKRTGGHDLAQLSVAVFRSADGAYDMAFGALSATAALVKNAAGAGEKPDAGKIVERALSAISPISDVRCSREYRLDITAHFLRQALALLEGTPGKGAAV